MITAEELRASLICLLGRLECGDPEAVRETLESLVVVRLSTLPWRLTERPTRSSGPKPGVSANGV